jgi:hypothetical protein
VSIGSDGSDLRDDDDSGKAAFVATGPVPLLLPNLLAKLLLLLIDEKSDRSVPELAAIDGVLLSDTAGKGELDWRYRRMVFWGLVARMLEEDEEEEETPPLRSLGLERTFDVPLAF